jgi:predicted dehydrogenase
MTEESTSRRSFVASSAGLLILKPETVFGTQANSAIELGIVGCGGRGNWIGDLFLKNSETRIVALADVVRQRLDEAARKFNVDGSRAYHGPDAGRQLAASKLDAVAIESPPFFHPEQAMAAVNEGKHVYCAKPIAVDVPGCNAFLAAGRKAKGKLSFLADFQTRARPVFQEAAARIHRGDIGAPALAQVYYYAGRPNEDKSKPGMDPGLARILNWVQDRALSGDIIVEQNIHVIDMANWFLQGHPVKAYGTGGRTGWSGTRYDYGDAWDHFAVTYYYPGGCQASFSSHQLTNSYSSLTVRCFGTKGAADTNYGGLVRITGENPWTGAQKDDTFTGGAIANIKAFVASLHSRDYLNNAESAVDSTLTSILGRMAAYHGREVTWDEMMKSRERYEHNLTLRW